MKTMFEGQYFSTEENSKLLAQLRQGKAIDMGTYIEAIPVKWSDDSKDLYFYFGENRGVMSVENQAIPSVTRSNYHYLSENPIGFYVKNCIPRDNGTCLYVLSRKAVQEQYYAEVISKLVAGEVINIKPYAKSDAMIYAEIGYGYCCALLLSNITYSRMEEMIPLLTNDEVIPAIFTNEVDGRIYITQKELRGTWIQNYDYLLTNVADCRHITGVVTSNQPFGTFIALTTNLTGLLEESLNVSEGQLVEVIIRTATAKTGKIKLELVEVLPFNVLEQNCNEVLPDVLKENKYFISEFEEQVAKDSVWYYVNEMERVPYKHKYSAFGTVHTE